ncbi:pentatricopeptide repeat-containing protein [Senna tora]|uniref:Pentatricopeptide repeat-containing protein n=1 Tax=Senna tora TaxID=362788 RepID=A0A834TLZ6_9FABA|nr:pentatricopeptide repeat-containing protein [Senna tora]
MVLLTLSVWVIPEHSRKAVFFTALYILAVGEGGHKPSVQTFAADQFDEESPQQRLAKASFFNYWYLGIIVGATSAVLLIIYVQDNIGWAISFGILAAVLAVAFGIFLSGIYKYRKQGPLGSPFTAVAQVFVAAVRKWRVNETRDGRRIFYGDAIVEDAVVMETQTNKTLARTKQFRFLDKAMIIDDIDIASNITTRDPWRLCSLNQVEETKLVLGLIPIWLASLYIYLVQAQISTFFTKQGSTMVRSMGPHFTIPPASLQCILGFSVILILPIYDRFLVPMARNLTGKPTGITMLQRIGIGLFLSFLSILMAALVESKRLKAARDHNLLDNTKAIVPIRVWWLLPQYILSGFSDAFAIVGLQHLFYDQMPEAMRSMGAAFYISNAGVGNFVSSAIIGIVEAASGGKWLGSNNLNRAHLDGYYYVLAGLGVLDLGVFVFVARRYVYKRIEGNNNVDVDVCVRQEKEMLFVARGETPFLPMHIAFLRFLNRSFECIKYDVGRIFSSVFCSQPNMDANGRTFCEEDILSSSPKDLMSTMGKDCQLNAQDWSRERNFGDKNGPQAVFNALDNMLKDSLDRLQMMRKNLSLAKIVLQGYTHECNYAEQVAIIRHLCLEGKLFTALWLRSKMIQKGFLPDVFTHNHLVNALCKMGLMEKADELIKWMLEMGPSPNCATYNTFIKGYCLSNNVDVDKALDLFDTMADAGFQPNRVSWNIVLHALCGKGLVKEAKMLFEKLLDDDNGEGTPDLVTSTILMDHHFKNGAVIQALSLWDEMLQKNRKIDVIAYNVLIHGLCMSQNMNLAYGYACEMFKKGLLPDVLTYNTLLDALCKEDKIDEACYMLDVMSKMGVMPDPISYKIMIRGLCFNGYVDRAKQLLRFMLENSMVPEPLIWNLLIDCNGRSGDLNNARFMKDQMLAFSVRPNVFTYNILIHAHVKSGNIDGAFSLKKEMASNGLLPDVVTYNLLIGASFKFASPYFAHVLHDEMLKMGCEPDLITYTELIRGRCMIGNIKEAEELFAKIQKSGLLSDHVPVQILFNKYCKLEEPVMAFNVYQDWSTLKFVFLRLMSTFVVLPIFISEFRLSFCPVFLNLSQQRLYYLIALHSPRFQMIPTDKISSGIHLQPQGAMTSQTYGRRAEHFQVSYVRLVLLSGDMEVLIEDFVLENTMNDLGAGFED